MSGRSKYETSALMQRRDNAAAVRADIDRRVARAVADVLDGTVESCLDAAKGRGVPVHRVRDEVRARRGGR